MNKKIWIAAGLSILIQLLFIYGHLKYMTMFAFLFYLIAIPFAFYHLFNNGKPGLTAANAVGVLLTFPLLVIGMMVYYSNKPYKETDIDPELIELYDADGNEIPKDSLLQRLETDSTAIDRVLINEE